MNRLRNPITCAAKDIGANMCGESRLKVDHCVAIDRAVKAGDDLITRDLLESYGLVVKGDSLSADSNVIIYDSDYQCNSIW